MIEGGLGRRPLPEGDTEHLIKYPIRTLLPQAPRVIERTLPLVNSLRPFYNQGKEGACVGYSSSWCMSILNRERYDAYWLYKEAQKNDEWPGEEYSGTSVRAGMEMLRTRGHKFVRKGRLYEPRLEAGISEYRWAESVDEVRSCIEAGVPVVLGIDWMSSFYEPELLKNEYWIGHKELGIVRGGPAICAYGVSDRRQAVKLVNSWGSSWPTVWLPYTTLELLLKGIEAPGEAAIITDGLI